jgi:hypothetical protein
MERKSGIAGWEPDDKWGNRFVIPGMSLYIIYIMRIIGVGIRMGIGRHDRISSPSTSLQ